MVVRRVQRREHPARRSGRVAARGAPAAARARSSPAVDDVPDRLRLRRDLGRRTSRRSGAATRSGSASRRAGGRRVQLRGVRAGAGPPVRRRPRAGRPAARALPGLRHRRPRRPGGQLGVPLPGRPGVPGPPGRRASAPSRPARRRWPARWRRTTRGAAACGRATRLGAGVRARRTARRSCRGRAGARPAPARRRTSPGRREFADIAGREQNARCEDAAARGGLPLLVCDTDALATAVWHERYLGDPGAGGGGGARTRPARPVDPHRPRRASRSSRTAGATGSRSGSGCRDASRRNSRNGACPTSP